MLAPEFSLSVTLMIPNLFLCSFFRIIDLMMAGFLEVGVISINEPILNISDSHDLSVKIELQMLFLHLVSLVLPLDVTLIPLLLDLDLLVLRS